MAPRTESKLNLMESHNTRPVEEDIEEIRDRMQQPQLTKRGAIMAIIKCGIGAGSFNLPRAFMDGGVYMATVTTIFLGFLSAFTLLLLVDSSTISSIILEVQERVKKTRSKALRFDDYKPVERLDSERRSSSMKRKHCSTYPEVLYRVILLLYAKQ